jgi:hypothetical protein
MPDEVKTLGIRRRSWRRFLPFVIVLFVSSVFFIVVGVVNQDLRGNVLVGGINVLAGAYFTHDPQRERRAERDPPAFQSEDTSGQRPDDP